MYFGRPSSRPYSYAVEHCGCLQGVIDDGISSYAVEHCGDYQGVGGGIYMQCRGEWKLARVAHAVSAMRVLRATSQSPLQLRGGALW